MSSSDCWLYAGQCKVHKLSIRGASLLPCLFNLHGHSGPRSVSGLFCMGILGLVLFQIESQVEHFQDWVRHLLSAHDYVVVLGCVF